MPATASAAIGSGTVIGTFSALLCGPTGQPVPFDQAWLKVDLVLLRVEAGGRTSP